MHAVDAGDADADGEQLFQVWLQRTKRPADGYLRVDAAKPIDIILTEVETYLDL